MNKAVNVMRYIRLAYVEWISNPRMLIIPMTLVFLLETVWSPVLAMAKNYDYLINIIEPIILITNKSTTGPLIIIIFIMLISDFPSKMSSGYYVFIRSDRRAWVINNLIFSVLAAISWQLIIVFTSILIFAARAFWANAWSLYTTQFYLNHLEIYISNEALFVESSIYSHFKPAGALFLSLFLQLLSMVYSFSVILLFKLLHKHYLGVILLLSLYFSGMMAWALVSPIMWIFPTANSVIGWHYDKFYSGADYPVWCSIVYFLILIFVNFILCLHFAKNYYITENDIQ